MEKGLLEIGKIVKAQGLKGQLRVTFYGESAEIFDSIPYIVVNSNKEPKPLKILSCTRRKQQVILKLEGITSIALAEPLIGSDVFIPKELIAPLPPGEYYWFELVGLQVETEAGEVIGELIRIFPTGSNDVYVIQARNGELLIPATDEVIKEIDIPRGRMVIRPLEGLWENDHL